MLLDLGVPAPVRPPFLSSPPDVAIVTLPDPAAQATAIEKLSGYTVDGRKLVADRGPPAEAPSEVEAKAMGGGGGGRGQQGQQGGRGGRGGGGGGGGRGGGGRGGGNRGGHGGANKKARRD